MTSRRAERPFSMWSVLGQFVSWCVIIGIVGLLSLTVLIPRVAGATPYTVLTGSMTPRYPPGTLVVVKPVDMADLSIGDVITYQLNSGEPEVVTHRIVAMGSNTKGEPVVTTQGDANNAPDDRTVKQVQVRGKLWYAVPYVGRFNQAFSQHDRQIVTVGVAVVLLGYAATMFVGATRDRARGSRRKEKVS